MQARLAVAREEGLTEAEIAEIPNYQTSTLLSPREKTAIQFAEVLAGDVNSASDALFDELRVHFTEPEIADLGWRIVSFVGYGRLVKVLGLEIGQTCPLPHTSAG